MEMLTRSAGEKEFPNKIPVWGWMLFIVILAVGWKVIWLAVGAFPFNSDEAITGLMARHILQGERPVFFYGQAYMGSLDAFLAAGLFSLLGDTVLSIRILQILLYTCTIISTAWLGWKLTYSWETGLMAAVLMAIPAVNVTLYTTVSLGGYGEALVLSNCAFLCAMHLQTRPVGRSISVVLDVLLFGLLGFITGLGFWVFGLSLVATFPASVFGVIALWRSCEKRKWVFPVALLVFAALFFVGSFPWWEASLQAGLGTPIRELFGSAISVEKGNWLIRTGNHLFYYVFLGLPAVFGLRPPWEVRWLALPLLPFALMGWGLAFWRFPRILRNIDENSRKNWYLLIASVGVLTAGFLFTSFGLDPSGRYFLPLAVPFSLMIVWVISSSPLIRSIRYGLIIFLVVFNGVGTIQSALKNPPGITTQFDRVSWIDHRYDNDLMAFLRENGETRGYSNYWVAYPIAFQSGEEILLAPRLPYHDDLRYTARDDRIPEYTRQVESSPKTAYITTFNPALDQALKLGFIRLGITWQEKTIGDYHVFFDLNRPVHPSELQTELSPINETSLP